MMVRLRTKNNKKSLQVNLQGFLFVRLKGLEPPRLSSPDPKSGAATNYATAALDCGAKVMLFCKVANVCYFFYAFSFSDFNIHLFY